MAAWELACKSPAARSAGKHHTKHFLQRFLQQFMAAHAATLTDLPPVCRGAMPHTQLTATNIFFMKIKSIQAIWGWGKSVFH